MVECRMAAQSRPPPPVWEVSVTLDPLISVAPPMGVGNRLAYPAAGICHRGGGRSRG